VRPIVAFTGCYTIPAIHYDLSLVATNKLPQSAYRGMGLTPHNFVLEQMMDIAARDLAMDPTEFRRRNYIPADQFPYTIPSGNQYDSGNYEQTLDCVLTMADYPKLRREQAEARKQGRCLGIGVVNTVEPGVFSWSIYSAILGGVPGTGVPEGARVSVDPLGKVTCRVGFPLEGQGQYTFVAQLLADYFAVALDDVQVLMEDTLSAPPHFGPGGSRQAVALSGAVLGAAEKLSKKMIKVAARLMECEPDDAELMDGSFQRKGAPEVKMPLTEVVGVMLMRSDLLPPDVEPSPEATYVWVAPDQKPPDEQGRAKTYLTTANSCHVAVVEVDLETGQVRVLGYYAADDCGVRLNPAIVEGMIQGGVAQGVGASLLEEYVFDDQGQLLSSTLMDYLLPGIHEVPMAEKAELVTPSPFTPLGAKGMGEAAMLTTQAAMMSAINDALAPLGVRATETPASPERLWKLIRGADRSSSPGTVA
jgi:CO/xanthine dehydrogenase Mo-binding subunit